VHLAEIAPSIFAGLGLSDAQDLLGLGPSPHGRECLFLIDGLGEQALIEYAPYAPTLSGLVSRGPVTTAFPSTTVTSLTTLMTGELPGAHGMLGYTIRVPRSGGRILNSLKWDERVDPYTSRMWRQKDTRVRVSPRLLFVARNIAAPMSWRKWLNKQVRR
jgi:hypothetical protein